MNQSCVNQLRETSMLSTAEDQPSLNSLCYVTLLGPGHMAIPMARSPLRRTYVHHEGRMEHDQGTGSKASACHRLDFSMCRREVSLIHSIAPCGFAYTPSLCHLVTIFWEQKHCMFLYELRGSCCSPCRKYLLFGKTSRPNLVVESKLSLSMVSIFLSQDEEKYDHQAIKFH